MKMKRFLSCIMVVAMAVSLCACGNSASGSAASTGSATTSAAAGSVSTETGSTAVATGSATSSATQASSATYVANEEALAKVYAAVKDKNLKIACSNSYIGNTWRAQMVNSFSVYCQYLKDQGVISEYYSSSCGNDSDAQINEISNMISAGYNIIVVDAASPTALVSICEEAMERGVIIVGFDSTIDSDNVYNVTMDQVEYGKQFAEFIAKKLNGTGNIINIRGVEGSTVDQDREEGIEAVLAGYPDIHIVAELWGGWDDATTSSVLLDSLSSLKGTKIDGIIESGGENGMVEALNKSNISLSDLYVTGDCTNGFFREMVEEGLKGVSCADPPCLSCAAVQMGLEVAAGKDVEPFRYVELPVNDYNNASKMYMSDMPDTFLAVYTDTNNTYHISPEDVLVNK